MQTLCEGSCTLMSASGWVRLEAPGGYIFDRALNSFV